MDKSITLIGIKKRVMNILMTKKHRSSKFSSYNHKI